jgi:hypothetical protein
LLNEPINETKGDALISGIYIFIYYLLIRQAKIIASSALWREKKKKKEKKYRQIHKTSVQIRPERQRKDRTPERETTDTTNQPYHSGRRQLATLFSFPVLLSYSNEN